MWHLGRVSAFAGFLAVLALYGATDALAQKKKNKDKDSKDYPRAEDADYKAIQKQKELSGTLVAIDTGNVTIRVDFPTQVANPKYKPPKDGNPKSPANQQAQLMRTYNDLQNQMQKATFAKNPREALAAQQRIQQDMLKWQQQYNNFLNQMQKAGVNPANIDPNNQPFLTQHNTKDFDLEVMEKCVFRKLNLPFEYDDTGNVKTYTKEEKDDLRGDDRTKPGYMAKYEELKAGQEIKLSLVPPKKPEKDKDADKDKEKDKDAPKEAEPVLRPTVKMVVITKDNSDSNLQGDDGKKKKKDKK